MNLYIQSCKQFYHSSIWLSQQITEAGPDTVDIQKWGQYYALQCFYRTEQKCFAKVQYFFYQQDFTLPIIKSTGAFLSGQWAHHVRLFEGHMYYKIKTRHLSFYHLLKLSSARSLHPTYFISTSNICFNCSTYSTIVLALYILWGRPHLFSGTPRNFS